MQPPVMRKSCSPTARTYFGIKEEYVALAMIAPLIFACMVSDPLLVSVENFNNGQPSVLLNYGGMENQSFEFNISKYVAQGNWSQDGVMRNMTFQLCPAAGSPSNLQLFFPETGGSTTLYAGTLTSCENVTVDTSGFDPYFSTNTGTLLSIGSLAGIMGGGSMPTFNFMMLRNPKMYDAAEQVYYTMLWPYAPADEVHYRCFEGDSDRILTSPAREWHQVFPIPPLVIALISGETPIPLPVVGNVLDTHSTIWDMPCPAYGTPGRYTARVMRVHTYLDGIIWPDYFNVTDDFNNSEFNTTMWDVRTANSTLPPVNYSVLRMESPLPGTGINAFYSRSVTPNATQRFNLSIRIYGMDINGNIGSDAAGIIAFMNSTDQPNNQTQMVQNLTNMLVFNGSGVMTMCSIALGSTASAALGPGPHDFSASSDGSDVNFYLDGAFFSNCSGENGINQTVYLMVSPDVITDAWAGNISLDSFNATFEDWNGTAWVPYVEYDDDFSSLNSTAWLILNDTATGGSNYSIQSWLVSHDGFAYYINNWTESKLDLYSYAGDYSSGIIAYYNDPVIYAGSNISGLLVNATINYSAFAGEGLAGFFLTTEKADPSDTASTMPYARGAIFYNNTDYLIFCDVSAGGPPDASGTFNPGDPDTLAIAYDIGGSSAFAIGHDLVTTCTLNNETLYLGFTSDPFTDAFNGNSSVGSVSILSLNLHPVTGWRWYEADSPVWAMAPLIGFPSLNLTSDVIIRDCDDPWNCPYEFNLSSDTAGTVNISIVNVTYENMLGYRNGMQTNTFTNSPLFSWMGSNSTVINSEVRYQSGLFDSRVEDSDIILSDLFCTNVTDSTVHATMRLSEFREEMLGGGLSVPSIRFDPNPCGVIENSQVEGGMFLGGSVYNSNVTSGGGLFMDLYNAQFDNYTLRRGTIVLNVTKYGANAPQWLDDMGMPNDTLDISVISGPPLNISLPLGCEEGSVFAVQGFPNAILGNSDAPFACWIQLYEIHLVFNNMSVTGSSIGGPTLSLRNASFTIGNMSEPFNLMMRGDEAYLLFWNLDTGAGALDFDSRQQYVEDDLLSLNSSFYTWANDTVVTIGFDNLQSFDGRIFYYPGFTDDHALVLQNGTECNESNNCHNITWDAGAHTLTFNVTNFSTYAIIRLAPVPPDGGDEERERIRVDVDAGEVDEETGFLAIRSGGNPLPYVTIRIYGPGSTSDLAATVETGIDGLAYFMPESAGEYYFIASRSGYRSSEGTFMVTAVPVHEGQNASEGAPSGCTADSGCANDQACIEGACSALEPGECGYFESHAWVSYACCENGDCGQGEECAAHSCVNLPAQEQPPVLPPTEQQQPAEENVPPSAGPEGLEAEKTCCLGSLCGVFGGLCWYWWLVIFAGLLAVLAGVVIYKELIKGKRGRK